MAEDIAISEQLPADTGNRTPLSDAAVPPLQAVIDRTITSRKPGILITYYPPLGGDDLGLIQDAATEDRRGA